MSEKEKHSYLILPVLISLGIVIFWLMWGGAHMDALIHPFKLSWRYRRFLRGSHFISHSTICRCNLVFIVLPTQRHKYTNTQLKMLIQQLEESKGSKTALENQARETERASKIAALQSKLLFFSEQSSSGLTLFRNNACTNLYEHSLDVEVIRLISSIDELIKYRGKRLFYLPMGRYDLCKVWSNGLPLPKVEVTPVRIRNSDILFLIELPAEYECELYQVNNIEPGELWHQTISKFDLHPNEKARLTGEGELYFNVSMGWGMYPHSIEYPITIQTASGFNRQYYVQEKTIIDKPES